MPGGGVSAAGTRMRAHKVSPACTTAGSPGAGYISESTGRKASAIEHAGHTASQSSARAAAVHASVHEKAPAATSSRTRDARQLTDWLVSRVKQVHEQLEEDVTVDRDREAADDVETREEAAEREPDERDVQEEGFAVRPDVVDQRERQRRQPD